MNILRLANIITVLPFLMSQCISGTTNDIVILALTNRNIVLGYFNYEDIHKQIDYDSKIGYMFSIATNGYLPAWIPSNVQYLYNVSMSDSDGKELAKTTLGKSVGRHFVNAPTNIFPSPNGFLRLKAEAGLKMRTFLSEPAICGYIYSPNEIFRRPKSGKYRLKVQIQIYVQTVVKNGYAMTLLRFPPIEQDIIVEKKE